MHASTPHPRPELKVYGDNIVFVFPRTGDKPADQVHRELWMFAALTLGLLVMAIVLLVSAAADLLPLGMGSLFLLMAIAAGMRGIYAYRRRHQQVEAALERTPTELSVEGGCLLRRYASGRAEVWPRSEIHDVMLERRVEYLQREEDTEINFYVVLCLVLQTGRRVDLWERAPAASLQEQDLQWMANEFRSSLRVPHGATPPPVEGVKLAKTADGITIEVPHKEPLAEWRANIHGFLAMGGSIGGILYFATGFVFLASWHRDGLEGIDWTPITVLSILGTSFVVLACIGILVQLLGKKWIVRDITDKTPAWIGVRAGCLFRRYLSGREETWPAEQVAAVRNECVKDRAQVRHHLKSGAVEHLYGDLPSIAQPREREALSWIADQLMAALFPIPVPPAQTPSASNAIIDLTSPRRDDGQYRSIH
jgi:hypothetical protein